MSNDVREAVRLPDQVWEQAETRAALRDRRVAHLFRLAQKYTGASQTRIARVTGMDQSEVSRIKNGDRRVTAIDVLERVADGFGMPDEARMLLGLAPRRWSGAARPASSPPQGRGAPGTRLPRDRAAGGPRRRASDTVPYLRRADDAVPLPRRGDAGPGSLVPAFAGPDRRPDGPDRPDRGPGQGRDRRPGRGPSGRAGAEPGRELTARTGDRRAGERRTLAVPGPAKPPVPATEFVGRVTEQRQLVELLAGCRLVTLVGPPGIGKTRLAATVADASRSRFAHGTVLVPLACVETPAEVVAAVAAALGLPPDAPADGPADAPVALGERVARFLADLDLLLVLDTFEHVLDAGPVVRALLAAAPRLTVLVTSQERLRLSDEQVYPVPPLALPDPQRLPATAQGVARTVAGSPALRLFAVRARQAAYGFGITPENLATVVELCRRLDGLPLAIELAAARCDQLTPADLLERLDRRLDLLADGPRDVPDRQRTVRGALDWSLGLLAPAERHLLAALAAFPGPFTVEDAAALVATDAADPGRTGTGTGRGGSALADRLRALADRSLLQVRPDGDGYVMLGTVRAYAAELPAAGS